MDFLSVKMDGQHLLLRGAAAAGAAAAAAATTAAAAVAAALAPPPPPGFRGIMDSDHKHSLQHDKDHTFATCDKCKEIWIGKMFRCPLPNCNFSVHEYCASPFLQPIVTVRFYNHCVFNLFRGSDNRPHPICNACGLNIRGYMYKCNINHQCQRVLHPSCALLRTLEFEGKKFNLESGSTSKCSHCGEVELWRGDRTWWFVSSGNGKHRIHVSCAKKLLVEYLEKMRENGGGCVRGGVVVERTDASVSTVSQIVQVRKRPKRWRRGAEVVKMVGRFLMLFLSVLLGDPTFMLVNIYDEIFRGQRGVHICC